MEYFESLVTPPRHAVASSRDEIQGVLRGDCDKVKESLETLCRTSLTLAGHSITTRAHRRFFVDSPVPVLWWSTAVDTNAA